MPRAAKESTHPPSGRRVRLHLSPQAAWLHLFEAKAAEPIARGFVCNRLGVGVADPAGFDPVAALAVPHDFAASEAVLSEIEKRSLTYQWSTDGGAVALLIDGSPWAMLRVGDAGGFSQSLGAVGPWGSPWSFELFLRTFRPELCAALGISG